MIGDSGGDQDLEAEEGRISTALAARVAAILTPYREREGAEGFPAIVAAEADEILAMSLSPHEMAESIAAYRRRFNDQSALALVIMEALVASESFRAKPTNQLSKTIAEALQTVKRQGRKPRESERSTKIIGQIYPAGVPADVSHAKIVRKVQERCDVLGLDRPSRDTVIRAIKKIGTH